MHQVAKGQRWRRGSGPVWIIDRLDAALVHLHEEEDPTHKALITAASLAAGDGGWEPAQSVEDLMRAHGVTEPTARRMLATGERKHEAVASSHYLWDAENYPAEVTRSPHFHEVLAEYAHTLNPNPDARAFITVEVLNRMQADRPDPPREKAKTLEEYAADYDATTDMIRALANGAPSAEEGVPKVVSDLREARGLLDQYALPFLSQLAQRQVDLSDLLQAASEHLDELYGPQFEAYRCDECGRVVSKQTLNDLLGNEHEGDVHYVLGISVSYAGTRNEHYLNPVSVACIAHTPGHGPMRHVLARVTADDPTARESAEQA
jgi:hypothetical protein